METNQSNNILKKKNWKKILIILVIVFIFFPFKEPERMAICYAVMRGGEWTTPLLFSFSIYEETMDCRQDRIEHESCVPECENNACTVCSISAKPVIYLYPEQKQNIQVKLNYNGEIFADYPKYDEKLKGWSVTAYPDGKIINHSDNQEYSYLFWEGKPQEKVNWDLSKGFIVRGEDTKEFLQQTLSKIGLTPKEYNEFIVYWFPLMQDNKYNLIHFADTQYTDNAQLTIDPQPDSLLRVFMVYKPLEERRGIEAQEIKPFERKGFTVIEWGGTKVE